MNSKRCKELYAETSLFFYDPDGGVEFFSTEAEARKAAQEAIAIRRDDDEWPDDTEDICIGVVTHTSVETQRQERPADLDEDGYDAEGVCWQDIDYRCDYIMQPVQEG